MKRNAQPNNAMDDNQKTETERPELPIYESPKIEAMTEDEVLRTFQVTHAGMSWWVL